MTSKEKVGLGLLVTSSMFMLIGIVIWNFNYLHTELSNNLVIGSLMIMFVGIDFIDLKRFKSPQGAFVFSEKDNFNH